jgi:hypothetical protein
MFGYAVANIHTLTEQEKKRYREIYCGLCGVLRENYGIAGRTALTYDMVLLIMILSSLYNLEGEKKHGALRCPPTADTRRRDERRTALSGGYERIVCLSKNNGRSGRRRRRGTGDSKRRYPARL